VLVVTEFHGVLTGGDEGADDAAAAVDIVLTCAASRWSTSHGLLLLLLMFDALAKGQTKGSVFDGGGGGATLHGMLLITAAADVDVIIAMDAGGGWLGMIHYFSLHCILL